MRTVLLHPAVFTCYQVKNILKKMPYKECVNNNAIHHLYITLRMSNYLKNTKTGTAADALDSTERIKSLNNSEIIDILYRSYSDYIYSIVRAKIASVNLSDDDAEDCFSSVIIKLCDNDCKKVRQFKGGSAFKTYLTVICRNLATDYLRVEIRKERMTAPLEDLDNVAHGRSAADVWYFFSDNAETQIIKNESTSFMIEAVGIVRNAIENLEHQERLIVKLRVENEKTHREIDRFLGIDNSTYLFSKAVLKVRNAIDSGMRRSIEELLAEA